MAKQLRDYLGRLERERPCDLVRVTREIAPAKFEVTALLQHLENEKRYPTVLFEKPLTARGDVSVFPLLSNVFASRGRCALALGMDYADSGLPYAARLTIPADAMGRVNIEDYIPAPVREQIDKE